MKEEKKYSAENITAIAIGNLESQISSLKSQLAIPDIDRDKIIEVLDEK